MFAPDSYETTLTTVETLASQLEPDDGSNYVYVVRVTWEYDSEVYVIETPIDTDSLQDLEAALRAKVQRDEGIARIELITKV